MAIKAFACALKSNPEQLGIAISEHLLPFADAQAPTGVRIQALIGVLWNDMRSPAPSYHEPTEIMWLNVPDLTDEDEYEDDEELDDEDGVAAETTSNAGALA